MTPKGHVRFSPGPRGREWIVFVLSILLAFLVWFLVNLSQQYTGVISVPVVAQCNLDGYGAESSNTVLVSARCRTEGFRLVREQSRLRHWRRQELLYQPVLRRRCPARSLHYGHPSLCLSGRESQESARGCTPERDLPLAVHAERSFPRDAGFHYGVRKRG